MSGLGLLFLSKLCIISIIFFKIPLLVFSNPKVPCLFIFGDSIFDVGNNNLLKTDAKVNYSPYGIDFPQGPTGRFSNGLSVVDYIAKELGFKDYIPPFSTAKDVRFGINYASGGSGILDETGKSVGERICLNQQLLNHQTVISRMANLHGNETYTQDYLNKCIYIVGMGSNDYIQTYYAPGSQQNVTPEHFATTLIDQYTQQLKRLYDFGARKFAVFALFPIGCTPATMRLFRSGHVCVTAVNNAVRLFNDKLRNTLHDLNNNMKDAKFVYISQSNSIPFKASESSNDFVGNFTTCCKVLNEGGARGYCLHNNKDICLSRATHFFFDGFHPTEAVNSKNSVSAMLHISQLLEPLPPLP